MLTEKLHHFSLHEFLTLHCDVISPTPGFGICTKNTHPPNIVLVLQVARFTIYEIKFPINKRKIIK